MALAGRAWPRGIAGAGERRRDATSAETQLRSGNELGGTEENELLQVRAQKLCAACFLSSAKREMLEILCGRTMEDGGTRAEKAGCKQKRPGPTPG